MTNWQKVDIPFSAGLATKTNRRTLQPPGLAVCRDVVFDELGGQRTRRPYGRVTALDMPGSTQVATWTTASVADVRKIVPYRDELVLFTKDKIYSWGASDQKWVERSTYYAPKVAETSVWSQPAEQTEAERAELDGVVVYAWNNDGTVNIAALDKNTGAVLLTPVTQGVSSLPRLVALENKILLFASVSGDLKVKAIDVHDLATSTSFTTVDASEFNDYYDVTTTIGASKSAIVVYRRQTTTSYAITTVDEDLTITADTRARTCDGAITVARTHDGATTPAVCVVRANSTTIKADILNSDLSDSSSVNVTLGTAAATPEHIAAAFSSTDKGTDLYYCYGFWSSEETTTESTNFQLKSNWIGTDGTPGTQAVLANRAAVVSQAFDCDGQVMVWTAFAARNTSTGLHLQNSYFLYTRSADAASFLPVIVAKACANVGGGLATAGWLHSVQKIDDCQFATCFLETRRINLEPAQSPSATTRKEYASQSPRDVVLTLDSDDARRAVQVGRTLYITGAQVMQYDGQSCVEVGFPVFPYYISVAEGAVGALAAGSYTWLPTVRWQNAVGETERSAGAMYVTVSIAASKKATVSAAPVHQTNKDNTVPSPAFEVWRTLVDPSSDAPLYLVTDPDPTVSGDNGYIDNVRSTGNFSAYTDNLTDAALDDKETFPGNAGLLESLPPPSATVILSAHDRVFLAGVAGDPHTVYYSQTRAEGEIATFNDALSFSLQADGGPITALALLNDTVVVFKESATWIAPGYGFDNTGAGQNYGPGRLISTDVGATSAEAVAVVPDGVMVKSAKGWYLLDRGFSLRYIGAAVADFDDDDVVAVHVLDQEHHVRCVLKNGRVLLYDYVASQWSDWSVDNAVGAALWQKKHVLACSDDQIRVQRDFGGAEERVGLDVETAWIRPGGVLEGYARIRRAIILGDYVAPCKLRVRVAYNDETDENGDAVFSEVATWDPAPKTKNGPLSVDYRFGRQKVRSFKLRLTAVSDSEEAGNNIGGLVPGNDPPPRDDSLKLTGITLEYGAKRGLYRHAAANKQGGSAS